MQQYPSSTGVSGPNVTAMHWALRLAVAGCFVGHGAFGILTKKAWVAYFGVWHIAEPWAWRLMPVVGTGDIAIGILTLFHPLRIVLLWMAFWGFHTAVLRPIAGEPAWELVERAGNFGVPLALLWSGRWPRSVLGWFAAVRPGRIGWPRASHIAWILRVTTAAVLIGHGGIGVFMHKTEWFRYLGTLGIAPITVTKLSLIDVVGWFEIGLGLAIVVRPLPGLLLFAAFWKLATEALRLPAGEPFWEFVERGGSYAAPLALFLLDRSRRRVEARIPSPSEQPVDARSSPAAEELLRRPAGAGVTPQTQSETAPLPEP